MARSLLGILLALALMRGAVAFVPTMAGWGANVLRFVDPVLGAALWVALVAVILAPRAGALDIGLQRIGNAIGAGATSGGTPSRGARELAAAGAMVAVAALVWLFPDRVQFTGDFRMREGTLLTGRDAGTLFHQAMPLDVILHVEVPRALMAATGWDASVVARVLGALEAAAFAVVAIVFVRALRLRGGAATAALAVVLGGGYLGLFTGYGKAFAELSVATAAVGACGVRAVRRGSASALLGMGIAIAVAVAVHRSGIAVLPAAVVAWWLWWRAHGRGGAWRAHGATLMMALAIPLLTSAAFVPRALEIARRADAVHLLPVDAAQLGVWGAAFQETRLLDLVNLVALLSPLALAIPLLAMALAVERRRSCREDRRPASVASGEAWVLVALAAPLGLAMLFVHPLQGIFRDWDVFAPAGVALSLLAAWMFGRLHPTLGDGRLARAVVASAAVPTLVWLCHNGDRARGLERVEAFMAEAPARREAERATTWDFLAMAYSSEDRWEEAAFACEHAAAYGRSPRRLVQWGMVETMRRDYRKAQSLYADALARSPNFTLAWLGLAASSSALGDTAQCKRAARHIRRLQPRHPQLAEIESYLTRSRARG